MTPAQAGLVLVVSRSSKAWWLRFSAGGRPGPGHVLSGVGALLVALGLGLAAGLTAAAV